MLQYNFCNILQSQHKYLIFNKGKSNFHVIYRTQICPLINILFQTQIMQTAVRSILSIRILVFA